MISVAFSVRSTNALLPTKVGKRSPHFGSPCTAAPFLSLETATGPLTFAAQHHKNGKHTNKYRWIQTWLDGFINGLLTWMPGSRSSMR